MTRERAINEALRQANVSKSIVSRRPLSGGCIFHVEALTLDDGTIVVAKTGSSDAETIFREEAAGRHALAATNTVLVPQPLGIAVAGDSAVLVMNYIEPGHADAHAWRTFGEELARLHMTDAGERYGFDGDNHIGRTPQPNGWMNDWPAFVRDRRIAPMMRSASRNKLLSPEELSRLDRLCRRLETMLPARPKPALLHGDLWSGNALPAANGRVAVIDPAVSIGDAWADIAMMRLFGGFPSHTFDAYGEAAPKPDNLEQREAVYQLYHVLNHVNLFGRGYVSQAMALLDGLGC